jgi:hypothetical protein
MPYGLVAVGHFGRMFRRNGSEWIDLRRAIGTVWTDVWGVADDDVWFSGNSMAHFDGYELGISTTPTAWGLQSVRGAGSSDVWAVGCNGTVIHWDGRVWSDFSVEPWPQWDVCLWSVWSDAAHSVFATGSQGIALRWNGSTWLEAPALPSSVTSRALFGVGQDLLAIDDSGAVWQKADAGWQSISAFDSTRSNALWGTTNTDFWVAAEYSMRGLAVHVLEDMVSEQQVATTTLTGVWGMSASDVYLTGDGRVFHYDGQEFLEQPSGVHISNSKIWVSPSGTRWMIGGNGILRKFP